MYLEEIEKRISPLLAKLSARKRKTLLQFLDHPTCFSLFDSFENELFLRRENEERCYSLLMASCVTGEGKSTVAIIMAILAAVFGNSKEILLVDADYQSGDLADSLAMDANLEGLHDFFEEASEFGDCIHKTPIPNICFTPLKSPGNPSLRFSYSRFKEFLNQAERAFDLVIVDSSSARENKPTCALAKIVRHTLLVVQYNKSTRHQINNFKSELERAGAEILGVVINKRKFEIPRIFYGAGGASN